MVSNVKPARYLHIANFEFLGCLLTDQGKFGAQDYAYNVFFYAKFSLNQWIVSPLLRQKPQI